ncbi:hypothetical protein Pst134EB_011004 [Puccinia striiformis f. sp. tritici]|nr:hypothetical protein Pst134EB_011004 [Puccinia striiformis f. sp. tritici]
MDETDRDGGCRHKGLWAADRRQYRVIDNGAAERYVDSAHRPLSLVQNSPRGFGRRAFLSPSNGQPYRCIPGDQCPAHSIPLFLCPSSSLVLSLLFGRTAPLKARYTIPRGDCPQQFGRSIEDYQG